MSLFVLGPWAKLSRLKDHPLSGYLDPRLPSFIGLSRLGSSFRGVSLHGVSVSPWGLSLRGASLRGGPTFVLASGRGQDFSLSGPPWWTHPPPKRASRLPCMIPTLRPSSLAGLRVPGPRNPPVGVFPDPEVGFSSLFRFPGNFSRETDVPPLVHPFRFLGVPRTTRRSRPTYLPACPFPFLPPEFGPRTQESPRLRTASGVSCVLGGVCSPLRHFVNDRLV